MVFAPKKEAKDIGWGSRSKYAKSNSNVSNHHELKEEILTKKTSSLKRRERSNNKDDVPSPSSPNENENQNYKSMQKRVKDTIDPIESEKFSYYGNNNEAKRANLLLQPLKGRSLPDVELDTKKDDNVLSTMAIIQDTTRFAFVGRAKVVAHEGSVEILGYKLTSTSTGSSSEGRKSVMIDCPSWMNSLCISHKKTDTGKKRNTTRIEFVSMDHNKFSYELMNFDEARSPIVIDQRWNDTVNQMIQDFKTNGRNQNDTQDDTKNSSDGILICGAKNVGKSTFAKYLCNCFLSTPNIDRIAFLDCDVGQPELGPPGTLSLTILTKPLLCPPHVHIVCHNDQQEEESNKQSYGVASDHHSAYYYGSTSPKVNPLSFSNGVRQLMNDYKGLCRKESIVMPLVVNTDGWVKGMGYEILSSTIETVKPGHLVQILGSTKAKFFDMTPHAVPNRVVHVLYSPSASSGIQEESKVTAVDNNSDINIISPLLLRNLRTCSYFLGGYEQFLRTGATIQQNGIVDDDCSIALTLSRQRPYMVPFDAVTCTILNEGGINPFFSAIRDSSYPDSLLDALNGSVVGLCTDSNKNDTCVMNEKIYSYVALGIVRSIDRSKRLFYILTPASKSILQTRVTNIVLGQIQLPFECAFLGLSAEGFPYQTCDGTHVSVETKKKS